MRAFEGMDAEPESRVKTSNTPSRVEQQSITIALVFKRKKKKKMTQAIAQDALQQAVLPGGLMGWCQH